MSVRRGTFTLAPPPRPRRGESVVPLINIVFLLLVFFLLTATIAPPEPLPVTPPEAAGAEAALEAVVLHVGADGSLALGAARDDAALARIAADPPPALTVRADAALDGAAFADLLARLQAAGVGTVRLSVVAP
jgi:biopolymer transport protein ExbD